MTRTNQSRFIRFSIILGVLATGLVLFALNKHTLLKDPTDEITDGGFLSGEPCGPPCFLGIVPNVTSETEAIQILEANGLYKNCTFVNNESQSGLRGFTCARPLVGVSFFRGTDIVGAIGFYPSQPITVERVIAKYGEPDSVTVSSIWFNWKKQPETSMTLFYETINSSVSLGTQNGNTFNLTPATSIISIGYAKPGFPSVAEDEAGNKYLSAWHGYGEYHDLTNP